MNIRKTKKLKGNVALVAVVILGFVLLISGIALTLTGIDLIASAISFNNYTQSTTHSTTCVEESLRKISLDEEYVGQISHSYDGNECTAEVTNDVIQSTNKIITVTSTVNGYTSKNIIRVDASQDPIVITD